MEIKINLDSSSTSDLRLTELLGLSIQTAMRMFRLDIEDSHDEEVNDEEPAVEAPVVEEKPKKRSTKKKAKEEEPAVAATGEPETAEPVKAEEPTDSDLPFDNEPEETPKKEEAKFPTMTKDEFTAINKAKREELGLTVTGEHADLIRDFNVYCQKHAEAEYGNPKPSTLPGEELWQFAQWFQNIKLNPDYVAGSADEEHGNPFVSNAPSNI